MTTQLEGWSWRHRARLINEARRLALKEHNNGGLKDPKASDKAEKEISAKVTKGESNSHSSPQSSPKVQSKGGLNGQAKPRISFRKLERVQEAVGEGEVPVERSNVQRRRQKKKANRKAKGGGCIRVSDVKTIIRQTSGGKGRPSRKTKIQNKPISGIRKNGGFGGPRL